MRSPPELSQEGAALAMQVGTPGHLELLGCRETGVGFCLGPDVWDALGWKLHPFHVLQWGGGLFLRGSRAWSGN